MALDILTDLENRLPELVTNRQYIRCMDRLFASLPEQDQRRLARPMVLAAVSTGSGAACFRAALLNGSPPTAEERDGHRQRALEGIRASRDLLEEVRGLPGADPAELLVAGELLDRIEQMLRAARPD